MARVKKICGVPPPRFNLVSQVFALFHHDWSRFPTFDINMFINMMHIKTYFVFGVPPSRLDLVLQVKPTFPQTLLDATSFFIKVNKCSCSYEMVPIDKKTKCVSRRLVRFGAPKTLVSLCLESKWEIFRLDDQMCLMFFPVNIIVLVWVYNQQFQGSISSKWSLASRVYMVPTTKLTIIIRKSMWKDIP